jgi:hypothetical protein
MDTVIDQKNASIYLGEIALYLMKVHAVKSYDYSLFIASEANAEIQWDSTIKKLSRYFGRMDKQHQERFGEVCKYVANQESNYPFSQTDFILGLMS